MTAVAAEIQWWGDYTDDLNTNALSIVPTDGVDLPDDIDGEGSLTLEAEQLVLHDIWLGSSSDIVEPPACGHRFERFA